MPCGRCRQLLWENGGPECLVEGEGGPLRLAELLPDAFGADDLDRAPGEVLPARLREWQGRGTVFAHPDSVAGQRIWTAYWERSSGIGADPVEPERRGILEEAPTWPDLAAAIAWGRARTPRVIVVDADGGLTWAGVGEAPAGL
jgi:cytidine deaminase